MSSESSRQQRKCILLNTRKPELRYRVLKFEQSGRATGFCHNIFEKYVKRPAAHTDYGLNNMNLLEFPMLFEPYYRKRQDEDEESVDRSEDETEHLENDHTMGDNDPPGNPAYPPAVYRYLSAGGWRTYIPRHH